jgi:hypothetical protein
MSNNEDMSNKIGPMCGAIADGMDAATVATRWQQLQPQENIDTTSSSSNRTEMKSTFGIGARNVSYQYNPPGLQTAPRHPGETVQVTWRGTANLTSGTGCHNCTENGSATVSGAETYSPALRSLRKSPPGTSIMPCLSISL